MEDKFEKIMKQAGFEKEMRPIRYVAQIPFPHKDRPTFLQSFKTKKEFDDWYRQVGIEFEKSTGNKIELVEKDEDKIYE